MCAAHWTFLHDQFACGRCFRVLDFVDDVTHECLAEILGTSNSDRRVTCELTDPISRRREPNNIVSDHGTEFTSNAILALAKDHRVEWHYIAPDKPMQNGYIDPFYSRMRSQLLKGNSFIRIDMHVAASPNGGRISTPQGLNLRLDIRPRRLRRGAHCSRTSGRPTRALWPNRNGRD